MVTGKFAQSCYPNIMDWSSIVSAFVGAAIPSGITLVVLRVDRRADERRRVEERQQRALDRQWLDAEVVADVERLLTDIDPMRRSMNINKAEGAEAKLWADLDVRRDDTIRRLLVLSTGHPEVNVRELAQQLAVELHNSANATRWQVHDMLQDRDNAEWMQTARNEHDRATGTLRELKLAVQTASSLG